MVMSVEKTGHPLMASGQEAFLEASSAFPGRKERCKTAAGAGIQHSA
jgi:hypothetical protein